MNIEVKLVKKNVTITKEDGTTQRGTNFYLKVGNEYVPIQVVFFPNDKCEGRDPAFAARMAILSAVAESLPPKDKVTNVASDAKADGS
ncbi:MAG: hypothetical protein IJF38_07670 [Clostridia bacterium]|nr:hypothetical protein [Clostridia bacterium]